MADDIQLIPTGRSNAAEHEEELFEQGYELYEVNAKFRQYRREGTPASLEGKNLSLGAEAYVKEIRKENPQVDFTGVKGTGPNGVILKKDLEGHVKGQARATKKEEEKK